jgi:hypothetical protein
MQPDHCKGCKHLWTGGTKGKWCCLFGRLAKKAVGHCKLKGGKVNHPAIPDSPTRMNGGENK